MEKPTYAPIIRIMIGARKFMSKEPELVALTVPNTVLYAAERGRVTANARHTIKPMVHRIPKTKANFLNADSFIIFFASKNNLTSFFS